MKGIFSFETMQQMLRLTDELASPPPSLINPAPISFMGMQVSKSHVFPHEFNCGLCDGTGEGKASTYCERCDGAGRTRIEGLVQYGRQTTLLTTSLPKKFSPSFPHGLVPERRLSRGLV